MFSDNYLQKDRRLVVLRILQDSAAYTANESHIDRGLDALGHKVSRDVVVADMHWLHEQGLLRLEEAFNTQVATITQRGLDVAQGQAAHPGVNRPSPKY